MRSRYTYNDRGELTAAPGYLGSDVNNLGAPLPGRQHGYGYDLFRLSPTSG